MVRIQLLPATLSPVLGALIRDTRRTIGWSQDELADRAMTSQSKIHRMERDKRGGLDLETLDRVLGELGLRVTLEVDGIHVTERREQRDAVHATIVSVLVRRLTRAGWQVATEVPTGAGAPTGWIDLIAFRAADGAMLVIEVKTAIPDVGGLLRQVSFYEREASWAARRQGWLPERVAVAVVCLDSAQVRETLERNRDQLTAAFPATPDRFVARMRTPGEAPDGRALLSIQMRRRQGLGLGPTILHGRRSSPAYLDYADAAAGLRTGR